MLTAFADAAGRLLATCSGLCDATELQAGVPLGCVAVKRAHPTDPSSRAVLRFTMARYIRCSSLPLPEADVSHVFGAGVASYVTGPASSYHNVVFFYARARVGGKPVVVRVPVNSVSVVFRDELGARVAASVTMVAEPADAGLRARGFLLTYDLAASCQGPLSLSVLVCGVQMFTGRVVPAFAPRAGAARTHELRVPRARSIAVDAAGSTMVLSQHLFTPGRRSPVLLVYSLRGAQLAPVRAVAVPGLDDGVGDGVRACFASPDSLLVVQPTSARVHALALTGKVLRTWVFPNARPVEVAVHCERGLLFAVAVLRIVASACLPGDASPDRPVRELVVEVHSLEDVRDDGLWPRVCVRPHPSLCHDPQRSTTPSLCFNAHGDLLFVGYRYDVQVFRMTGQRAAQFSVGLFRGVREVQHPGWFGGSTATRMSLCGGGELLLTGASKHDGLVQSAVLVIAPGGERMVRAITLAPRARSAGAEIERAQAEGESAVQATSGGTQVAHDEAGTGAASSNAGVRRLVPRSRTSFGANEFALTGIATAGSCLYVLACKDACARVHVFE